MSRAVGAAVHRAICRHAELLRPGWPKRCDLNGKVIYATEESAANALVELNPLSSKGELYTYHCKPHGHYHLTRSPQGERRRACDNQGNTVGDSCIDDFLPRHAELARAILDNLEGDRVMRWSVNSALRWGVTSSRMGKGQSRITKALRCFERRGWIKRDDLSIIVIDRLALFTLVEWFSDRDALETEGTR